MSYEAPLWSREPFLDYKAEEGRSPHLFAWVHVGTGETIYTLTSTLPHGVSDEVVTVWGDAP